MKRISALVFLCSAVAGTALAWPWSDRDYYDSGWGSPPPPPPQHHDGWRDGWNQPPPPQHDWPQHNRHDRYNRHDRQDRHDYGEARGSHSGLVGEFSGGGAKEVVLGGGKRRAWIEISQGEVGFNTIVLRRGGNKQSITVSTRFSQGQRYDIPIDGEVTGIRISSKGNGRFRVYAK